MAGNLGIDVSVDLDDVGPSIVVVIDEPASPGDVLIVDTDTRGKCDITKSPVTVVVIKIAGVVSEVGFKNIEPAVAIVIGYTYAHSGLFVAVLAVGAARHHGYI